MSMIFYKNKKNIKLCESNLIKTIENAIDMKATNVPADKTSTNCFIENSPANRLAIVADNNRPMIGVVSCSCCFSLSFVFFVRMKNSKIIPSSAIEQSIFAIGCIKLHKLKRRREEKHQYFSYGYR